MRCRWGGSKGVSKERNEKVEAEVGGGGEGMEERGGKQWQQSHQTCCVWSKCVYPQLGRCGSHWPTKLGQSSSKHRVCRWGDSRGTALYH